MLSLILFCCSLVVMIVCICFASIYIYEWRLRKRFSAKFCSPDTLYEPNTGFRIIENKGFKMLFNNGYEVSVQFGRGNYCANQSAKVVSEEYRKSVDPLDLYGGVPLTQYKTGCTSPDAEIAVFWPEQIKSKEFYDLVDNTYDGNCCVGLGC